MDIFEDIMSILVYGYFIIIILPFIIGFAFVIGLFILNRLFDIQFEESQNYNGSKFALFLKKTLISLISIVIGVAVMYFSLKIINGISCTHRNLYDDEVFLFENKSLKISSEFKLFTEGG